MLKGARSTKGLQVRLGADASAAREARRAVETLGDRLGAQTIADLRAVVTELIGISLSSASDDPIELRLEIEGGHVRGEVFRAGSAGNGINAPGQALRILGALVEEWGIAIDRAAAWFDCLDTRP